GRLRLRPRLRGAPVARPARGGDLHPLEPRDRPALRRDRPAAARSQLGRRALTTAAAAVLEAPSRRRRGGAALRLLRRPTAAVAFVVVAALVLGAVAAPLVAPYPKNQFDYSHL